MRVVLHDYAGHPFQVELSRDLARRGHEVLHLYSASITTPRGTLERRPDDALTFSVEPVVVDEQIPRERLLTRRRLEATHGARVAKRLAEFAPHAVVSANAPLEAQKRIADWCSRERVRFVYWVQDLIGEATRRLLPTRLPAFARPIVWYYEDLEHRLLWRADDVVVISEDFLPFVPSRAHVIENWAPIEHLPSLPKVNEWSRRHGLDETTNLVYSGTIGMKHDPALLLGIADELQDESDVRIVVVSEGQAAEWLRAEAVDRSLENVTTLPFQPFESLPEMLASADVLLAVLARDAGVFSVPSKVLTYLCAERPLLLAVPRENLAAKIVERVGAGIVVEPEDLRGAVEAVHGLIRDPARRSAMGASARVYAERAFDLTTIADRFETILEGGPRARPLAGSSVRPSPDDVPGVSVVIVSYRCREALRQCLDSLAPEHHEVAIEIIVTDNASRDGTVEMVSSAFPRVRVIENDENLGFATAANRAIDQVTREYVLLLNPDTVVPPGALSKMVDVLERHPDVGMLGCKLVRPDGTFDHACKRGFPTISSSVYYFLGLHHLRPRSHRFARYTAGHLGEDDTGYVDAVNGAFMLVRRDAARDVGPIDERYWLYAEDLDWCHRFTERDWKILYWPEVEVVHWKGGSSGDLRPWALNRAFHRSMWLFYAKHHAHRHPRAASTLVWAGVWAKLGLSALGNAVRRPPRHAWTRSKGRPTAREARTRS